MLQGKVIAGDSAKYKHDSQAQTVSRGSGLVHVLAKQPDFSLEPPQHWDVHRIAALDGELFARFRDRVTVDTELTRGLVSFQGNKTRAFYRWFKYKEAFSAPLVQRMLERYHVTGGAVLDPFAGLGTTLFVASSLGLDADGIEVLPIGQEIVSRRTVLERGLTDEDIGRLAFWERAQPWATAKGSNPLNVLRITKGAYPPDTHEAIEHYLYALGLESDGVRAALTLALLCVLESISYTRKDGQYLRWDYRSGRRQGTRPFDKGAVPPFHAAISAKLHEIIHDITRAEHQGSLFASATSVGRVRLLEGSCLDVLPTLPTDSYSAIVTSPPYCNRYDYTRTYALELALLGIDETALSGLRQQMLTCTVENREKDLLAANPAWSRPIAVADEQQLLQAILAYLNQQRADGTLNNNGIPRMVRGYFYEMACVIAECARVLSPNAVLIMVNDNVRYAGASVSVDIILSDMAESLGFSVERILVLPNGKGNSSQQMGEHGRVTLRKCVYVWRKV